MNSFSPNIDILVVVSRPNPICKTDYHRCQSKRFHQLKGQTGYRIQPVGEQRHTIQYTFTVDSKYWQLIRLVVTQEAKSQHCEIFNR